MSGRLERLDWTTTALGAPAAWPGGLRAAVDVALAAAEPAFVLWGRDLLALYNDAWIPLLGEAHPAALGRPGAEAWRAAWPELWSELGPAVDAARTGGEAPIVARRAVTRAGPPGGRARQFLVSVVPLRDDRGRTAGLHGAASEVVEPDRDLAIEARRRARNVLAVARSLIRRAGETSADARGWACRLEGRLDAVVRAQGEGASALDAGLDLELLVRDELLAAGVEEERARVGGPTVTLRDHAAVVFSLAVHELVLNALEHGALAAPTGRLDVRWTMGSPRAGGADASILRLSWTETGATRLRPPERQGFGLELLERMLSYELRARATLRWPPTGLRCEIRAELAP